MEYFLLACILIEAWIIRRMWKRVKGNAILANENFINITKCIAGYDKNFADTFKCLSALDGTLKLEVPLLREIMEKIEEIEQKQQNPNYLQ